MKQNIQSIKNEALSQIIRAESVEELEQIKTAYLGRKGKLNSLFKEMKSLSGDQKKSVGPVINEAKKQIEKEIASKKRSLHTEQNKWFDPTIPSIKPPNGSIHPISQAIAEISNIFEKIGFVRVRYQEIEWDWFAFGSLNFSEWHPARDEWETFLIDEKPHPKYGSMLLTPHTSSGQVREMQRVKNPPIRMVNISKCYRRQSDASHYPMFHQFEGLAIDKGTSITHLKGTLDYFAHTYFGKDRQTRLRPYNFPFTEPSFEVDITCGICKGKGCKVCKEGWLELGGAGMVHPNVLKSGGIDPNKYTGFAFGWGVERVFMMKPGVNIPDLRLLYSTDIGFLEQF